MSKSVQSPSPFRRLRQRSRRGESGAAAVEFALVVIPLVFILYGLIAFGMMLALKQSVTSAAAEGARAAVGVLDDPATPAVDERVKKAQDTVADRLKWLGSKYQAGDLSVSWYDTGTATCTAVSPPAAPPSPPTLCVKITYPYEDRPLVPPAPGLGLITPETLGSEARVQVG